MTIQDPAQHEDSRENTPLFHGIVQVIDLVQTLYRRPRMGDAAKSAQHPEQSKGLPMLCLIRPDQHEDLLPRLSERMKSAIPHRVPHAFRSLERDPEPAETGDAAVPELDDKPTSRPHVESVEAVETIRDLLAHLAELFADHWNAHAGRLRFPRLSLAIWLMRQELSEPQAREAQLRTRLWRRDPTQRLSELIRQEEANVPATGPWAGMKAARMLSWIWFRLKMAGRIFGVGKVYRWFRRQPYLAPEVPGTFIGFAERLTSPEWRKENQEQVARFLTNAFLEDLRRSYGRFPWRRDGARRMSYAVLLLDNVTRSNGGYDLLRLINDIRNDTGRFDPLLVISGSRKVPPDAVEPTVHDVRDRVFEASEAMEGYQAWRAKLASDRRKREKMTWYLPLSAPPTPNEESERSAIRRRLKGLPAYTVDSPPLWSRRIVPVSIMVALLAGCMVGYSYASVQHCGNGMDFPWGSRMSLDMRDGECIGISDGSLSFNPRQPDQPEWQKIRDQNKAAEADAASKGKRLRTFVYLGTLSSGKDENGSLASQREVLKGVALAQKEHNGAGGETVVKILLANGGDEMKYGPDMAARIGAMAERDRSILGVIGLDSSNQNTVATLAGLDKRGIPSMATTLSANEIEQQSELYFQVAPLNSRQADTAAGFAEGLRGGSVDPRFKISNAVRVYRGESLYSRDLANGPNDGGVNNGVVGALRDEGFQVRDEVMRDGAYNAGEQACQDGNGRFDGLVYYAGSGVPQFGQFLDGIAEKCPNDPPVILASDDVTRHVADGKLRTWESRRVVPYFYQSFAVAPETLDPNSAKFLEPKEENFYCGLYDMFYGRELDGEHCPPADPANHSLDGHSALGYDAMNAMSNAAEQLWDSGVGATPGTLYQTVNGIRSVSDPNSSKEHVEGVTGRIDFGRDNQRKVPLNKPVSILRVDNGGEPQRSLYGYCGDPDRLADRVVPHECPPPEQ